jgi:signal transduction histidine kinase
MILLIAAMAIAAIGYVAMWRDARQLDDKGRGAMLWWGSQTEIDMLKFELRLAKLRALRSEAALAEVKSSFDVLWSRIAMTGAGAIGDRLREFDRGEEGALRDLSAFMNETDPIIANLRPDDTVRVGEMLRQLAAFHRPLRLYTLSVMREDAEIAQNLRDGIRWSAQLIVTVSGLALLLCFVSLAVMMREIRTQREMARISQRAADQADLANRTKSRFLAMMSHELRNPLNGVLGPLALLGQSDIGARQRRLLEQASQSGQAMSQMLESLLDYGEIQDGGFEARPEPMRVAALAEMIRARVLASTGVNLAVRVSEGTPEILRGDPNRLCQVFVNLSEYLLESCDPGSISLTFSYRPAQLVGEMELRRAEGLDWKLALLLELNTAAPDQVPTDALRPLITRGLLSVLDGGLALEEGPDGLRLVQVTLPARELTLKKVRVHLDTRSAALAAIYRAALRSDEVIFEDASDSGMVDLVLVDAARAEGDPEMAALRARYPNALFVSLGLPGRPAAFDEVVAEPNDFSDLRSKIMNRLAS